MQRHRKERQAAATAPNRNGAHSLPNLGVKILTVGYVPGQSNNTRVSAVGVDPPVNAASRTSVETLCPSTLYPVFSISWQAITRFNKTSVALGCLRKVARIPRDIGSQPFIEPLRHHSVPSVHQSYSLMQLDMRKLVRSDYRVCPSRRKDQRPVQNRLAPRASADGAVAIIRIADQDARRALQLSVKSFDASSRIGKGSHSR
jgi:hypothetical protein